MSAGKAGTELIQLLSCSTSLSMRFELLIKTKHDAKNYLCIPLKHSDVVIILPVNVKMPTIVGILTFTSRINMLS